MMSSYAPLGKAGASTIGSSVLRSAVVEMKRALPGRMFAARHKAKLKAEIHMLDHVISRLEAYISLIDQMALQGDSPHVPCGVWVLPSILCRIHHEFKSAHPFIREVIACLDADVRQTVGDVVPEWGKPDSQASWSDVGARMEALWLEGLARHSSTRHRFRPDGGQDGFDSLAGALETLRRLSGKKKFNNQISRSNEWDAQSLRSAIEQPLMASNKGMEWWDKCSIARAFAIGLADLWKKEDYKAIIYILWEAERLHVGRTGPDQAYDRHVPFAWATAPVKLAGPHLGKFGGDSDSYATFAGRLNEVRDVTLPLFVSELRRYRAATQEKVDEANFLQLGCFTLCATLLNASLVNLVRYLLAPDTQHVEFAKELILNLSSGLRDATHTS